jgi:uncharacterized protein YjbI with pentapeptide repeats
MTELLLDKGLAKSEPDDPVRDIARSSTLAAVRQLDGERKGILLEFLFESNLVISSSIDPIILLEDADLRDANLSGADLFGTDLGSADLIGANLSSAKLIGAQVSGAFLISADLSSAILIGAQVSGANLSNADLSGADLRDSDLIVAVLSGADLSGAKLIGAQLSGAFLGGANLIGAQMSGVDLSNANLTCVHERCANLRDAKGWTNEQFAQAESLVGATMPDGTKMTEEYWEEFKKLYGQ